MYTFFLTHLGVGYPFITAEAKFYLAPIIYSKTYLGLAIQLENTEQCFSVR